MVIRMRHTRAATGDRRSHHALVSKQLTPCPKCGTPRQRHRLCATCGSYRGKQMIDVSARLAKKEKKAKAKKTA